MNRLKVFCTLILLQCEVGFCLNIPSVCSGASWTTTGITVAGSSAGTSGSSLSLLSGPQDFDVDENQNIYVADSSNHRIVKWTSGATSGTVVAGQTGVSGSSSNLFSSPISVQFVNDSVFVSDIGNFRIQKWVIGASSGITVAGGTGNGAALNQISSTAYIYVDNNQNVYVSDYGNSRVARWAVSASTSTIVAGNNGMSTGLNQLFANWGIYVDSSNNVYIADRMNHRIVQWASGATTGTVVAGSTGVAGNSATLLNNPETTLFDTSGSMYVLDGSNYRVQRFASGSSSATTILSFATGTAANQLSGSAFPFLMRFDKAGNIYIGDYGNNRIQKYLITCPTTTTSTTTTSTTTTTKTTSTTTTSTTTTSTTTTSTTTTSTTTTKTTTTSTTTSTTTTKTTTTSTTSTTSVTTTTTTSSTTSTSTSATTATAISSSTTGSPESANTDLIKIVAPISGVAGAGLLLGPGIFLLARYLKRRSQTSPVESMENTTQKTNSKRNNDQPYAKGWKPTRSDILKNASILR